ncbi:MAG: hypothetical protein EXR98_11270 [Gemmataceae bacterium]|nr:hypothetical protein [Gemmataceae bacterium]
MIDELNIPSGTAPPVFSDPVIDAYKKDVDRTLLRENLKYTVTQSFEKHERVFEYALELREAGRKAAGRPKDLEIIAELQALLEERCRLDPSGT